MRHILNTQQFSKIEVEQILSIVPEMEEICNSGKRGKHLENKIFACVFFEPSTRTRLSFESAALRLGANILSVENAMENSSAHKGESIEDTVKILCVYADVVVIRHPEAGIFEKAVKVA